MWTEPYNPLYVWGSCFHQLRTLFIPGGASVQQGLSAAFEAVRLGWHRGAADKRYSLGRTKTPSHLIHLQDAVPDEDYPVTICSTFPNHKRRRAIWQTKSESSRQRELTNF